MLTREQQLAYQQHLARVTPCAQVASEIVSRANARAERYAAFDDADKVVNDINGMVANIIKIAMKKDSTEKMRILRALQGAVAKFH